METKGELKRYMFKNDFVTELAGRTGMTEEEADKVTHTFLEILSDSWSARTPVCFRGFGIFEIRPTSQRLARNPATMEDVMIPAGYKPIFRASRRLRASVNQNITDIAEINGEMDIQDTDVE